MLKNICLVITVCVLFVANLTAQDFTLFEYQNNLRGNSIIHADFNGDGVTDFVNDSGNSSGIFIAIANDDGIDFEQFYDSISVSKIRTFDVDFDDDVDIVASAFREDKTVVFQNDGQGNFVLVETPFEDYTSIDFVDVNADGVEEMLLLKNRVISVVKLPELTVDFEIEDSDFGFSTPFITSFDYDKDGIEDIAVMTDFKITILVQLGDQQFDKVVISESVVGGGEFFPVSLNDDDIVDFVVEGGEPVVLLSTGDNSYKTLVIPTAFNSFNWLEAADFDADGLDEIILSDGSAFDQNLKVLSLDFENEMFEEDNFYGGYRSMRKGGAANLNDDNLLDFYYYSSGKFITALQGNIAVEDIDQDGFTSDVDCDDNNPDVFPGAEEICDGLDNDCNGQVDEFQTFLSWWIDSDGDGFGEGPMESRIVDCAQPEGYVQNYDDCDDTNPDINPNADEIPNNGIDEDCDGMDLISSLHELSDTEVNIFPNPTSDYINILSEGTLQYKADLYSIAGSLIVTSKNIAKIDVGSLHRGIYILKVTDMATGKNVVERVVVE